jgi:diphosphomevalonate decarboxylase
MSSGHEKWIATAPSNIALVKYMGKSDNVSNVASNSSLSYTLDYLKSEVEVQLASEKERSCQWRAWDDISIQLSEKGKQKFLLHWQRCRKLLAPDFRGSFLLRSRNHFPSDCGLASSASSFAALTLAAYQTFSALKALGRDWNLQELASLSRQGSGSSCRSFYSHFVLWKGEEISIVESEYRKLKHVVVVVDERAKLVSSSEAHKRVPTSLLYTERNQRAEVRTQRLAKALSSKNWSQIFELTWADLWDMHVLFETSVPPFSYMLPESLKVLREVQNIWQQLGDGPVVTMDAGANVHLLYRDDQFDLANKNKSHFQKQFKIYSDI